MTRRAFPQKLLPDIFRPQNTPLTKYRIQNFNRSNLDQIKKFYPSVVTVNSCYSKQVSRLLNYKLVPFYLPFYGEEMVFSTFIHIYVRLSRSLQL